MYKNTLKGQFVTLERLNQNHQINLGNLAKSEDIWEYMMNNCSSEEEFNKWFDAVLDKNKSNEICSFVIINNENQNLIGTISLKNHSIANAKIEVGTLWIGKEYWGKLPELKNESAFELLKYCFEDLELNKVEFRVDFKNIKSQNLIKKIGAKFDGNLRKDVKVKGVYSDSLVFSILKEEWIANIKNILSNSF